jgi:hypothetical protein
METQNVHIIMYIIKFMLKLTHPNHLAVNLLRLLDNRRLRQFLPTDLPDRF